jgi:thioredoxin:protein disulfide reductase
MTARHYRHAMLASVALALGAAAVAQDDDIIPPEQVFKYTATADAEKIYLKFGILDGYYLYRSRFSFATSTPGVTLGAPVFPKGEIHSDEYFGEQEIYRRNFEIAIPYRRSGVASAVALELRLQGCADRGFCYVPQSWDADIALPAADPLALGETGAVRGSSDDLLPVDEAFVMNARFDKPNELTVGWQIAPSYYLYRDKFTFEVDGKVELGRATLPKGKAHRDENFGDVEVFYDYVEAKVPFSRASPDSLDVVVTGGFQGCKDDSICYPPGTQTMALVLPATADFPASSVAASAGKAEGPISEQDKYLERIVNGSWWVMIGVFFVGGLGLSFTPCVLPMVPILSSIIAGQGGTVSTSRGFLLSLSYVLGMAATYTGAGALAALAGGQVQAMFQKPWIITVFAGLFVVLALGMFGLFELQMPTAVQTRLSKLADKQKGGTFIGVAVMGALTALIVTTCVAPPLIAALTAIAQTGDVRRGATALFAMSMGMGAPLLAVGASAGQVLPRVGPWMNTVKAAFGVMMVGVAIWMLERVLPGSVTLVLWALLVFLTGVFLGAFESLPERPRPARRLAKGFGVLACIYGALLLIGATLGGEDPLRPIPRGSFATASTGGVLGAARDDLDFRAIETVADLEAALGEARAASQPVMVDFTADWCVSCKEMEAHTFYDAGVIGALEPFVLLRADVTENNDDDQALLKRFNSFGPPTIAFFDRAGRERENFKLVGFVPPGEFSGHAADLAAL